jgi:lambda repressor-like predicted transcriptional regulator
MSNSDELNKDLTGVEDDDFNSNDNDDIGVDIDENDADEDVELSEILKGMTGDDDDTDTDTNSDAENDADSEPEEEKEELDPELEALVNKRVVEKLNDIIPRRLERDRKSKSVAKLEQLTGMDLDGVIDTVIDNMVKTKAEELYIDEEEARKIVMTQIENAEIKSERVIAKEQQEDVSEAMQKVNYLKDKTKFMAKPKLNRILKQYEKEIDAFTQNGKLLSFEDGMKYVLGSSLASGELLQKVQNGAEQKAARTATKRKASPQSKSTGAKSDTVTLTKEERIIAASLGISPKEYAEEKLKETNRKQRKSR